MKSNTLAETVRSDRFTMNLLIRIARPADLDAIGSLLVDGYSSSLATHYDDDLLVRALPHITKAQQDLLACGTYYVAEIEPGKLIGCGGGRQRSPIIRHPQTTLPLDIER